MNDLYKILGIEKTASFDQIKKAYFEMAKKYHPDSSNKAELEKFYEICEAYQVLSDKEDRRAYDLTLGGGKIEKVLVEEPPAHPTIFKDGAPKDEEFRKKEMFRFRRRIFLQGILRVIGFTVFLTIIGYILSFVLDGNLSIGLIAGLAIGLVWGINRNFDVASFIHSSKKLLAARIIGWILLVGGVGYFGWLVLKFIS
jgi:hypothetical protein